MILYHSYSSYFHTAPGDNTSTVVLIGALFGTLAALMLCIVVALIIVVVCVACHIRKSKTTKTEPATNTNPAYSPGAKGLITPSVNSQDRAVADNGLANPVYQPGTMSVVVGPSTTQGYSKYGAFVEPEYAVLDAPPLPPNPRISTDQENEAADNRSDPARTEEQDPISYEVLTPKQDPQYSHLNHNTRPTENPDPESPDPTYSHLNRTGGPAETGPDPATIHLDSDKEQDPIPYEIPVKK